MEFMFQSNMFYFILQNRFLKMQNILNSNNNKDNINNNENIENTNKINQDLIDVMKEPDIPPQSDNENYNIFSCRTTLSFGLNTEILTAFMDLNPDLLSGYGNNLTGKWAQKEKRGGKIYNPPNGWIGFGLNVLNKYDYGNNDWLACNGREGEWCVAYHGACRGQNSDKVKRTIKLILESNLKPGEGQGYKNSEDAFHIGRKVGIGVYCSPEIKVLDKYAGVMEIEGNWYKVGFMLRVKPDKIRAPKSHKNYWVLNGDFDELRPYRLLIKKISKFQKFINI